MISTRFLHCVGFALILLQSIAFGQRQELSSEASSVVQVDTEDAIAPKAEVGFAGKWDSTYGVLTLVESESGNFNGTYDGGKLSGKVDGRKLRFTYQDLAGAGEGWFEVSKDRQSFSGKWRADSVERWQPWIGSRIDEIPFDGLWKTTFGSMRLSNEGGRVSGSYYFRGADSTLQGEVVGRELKFSYDEPDLGTKGRGVFKLSADGLSFTGRWREDGKQRWSSWAGEMMPARTDQTWLIVLEAHWEERLQEPEYNFGEMLKSYFKMPVARSVKFRHRFFHDLEDLQRFARELKYFASPVVLVISTHGTPSGVSVFGDTIDSQELADCLSGASSLKMLHLSGCAMMAGSFPNQLQRQLRGTNPAITGYKTYVDWDASALSDFIFLTLVLIRGHDPISAIQQAIKQAPFLGEEPKNGDFKPLGLSGIAPRP
ncbi:MAG: hypothetical protein VXZ82_20680 [Planctomycetota bacterium]|nr:hypothetical protein [Planctomycetota bacterium]